MPIAFEIEEYVARPTVEVWNSLTDWKAAPGWMDGIDSMHAGGPTQVGTELVFLARGKQRPSEITAVESGRSVTLTSHQGPVSASYAYSCEPHGDGTRLRLVANCTIRGPFRIFGPLLRRAMARADGGQLAALRTLVESRSSGE